MTYFFSSAHPLLTYVRGSFGDGQVGAHAPGPAVVVLLAAAAVGPGGVVLALAAQLPLVEHAAVGVQVALAPETKGSQQKDRRASYWNSHFPEGAIQGYSSCGSFIYFVLTGVNANPGGLSDLDHEYIKHHFGLLCKNRKKYDRASFVKAQWERWST